LNVEPEATVGATWAAVVGAAAAYAGSEVVVRATGLPGAARRFTGSYEAGSFQPELMPVSSWLFDAIPQIDSDKWRLPASGREWSYRELFAGYGTHPRDYLERTFEEVGGYDELVVLRDIPVVSFCEHHMLPVLGRAHVGYLPTQRVVGIPIAFSTGVFMLEGLLDGVQAQAVGAQPVQVGFDLDFADVATAGLHGLAPGDGGKFGAPPVYHLIDRLPSALGSRL